MTTRRGVRRARRFSLVLIVGSAVALTAATQATVSAASASPNVIRYPGPINVTVSNALIHIAVSDVDVVEIGPFSGTMDGTIDATGQTSFPQDGIVFASFDQDIILGPSTILPVANGPWTGTIDPSNGTISLGGEMSTLVTTPTAGMVDCPIGPASPTVQGTNYDATTGTASVVDPEYMTPALNDGTEGCGGNEGTVNQSLGLPAVSSLTMDLTIDPVLQGVPGGSLTVTFMVSTTTAGGPGATTGSSGTLPRTGSATWPTAFVALSVLAAGVALLAAPRRHRRRSN